jgi:uncharacterized protein (TIGR01244 family)
MSTTRKINDELTIAGQIAVEQLPQLALEGYKSVLNLRSSSEPGFLHDERQKIESLRLHYANVPLQAGAIDPEHTLQVIQQIVQLPKPILLHCDSGMRSAAITLIYLFIKQGMTLEQALQKTTEMNLL